MVSDPKALAYALIDSFLQIRVNGKWKSLAINLDSLTPDNLKELIKNPEVLQKIECCINSIGFIMMQKTMKNFMA